MAEASNHANFALSTADVHFWTVACHLPWLLYL